MFRAIFAFEFRYWLSNPILYVYLGTFLILPMLTMVAAAGGLEAGASDVQTVANAPLALYGMAVFFNKLLLLLVPFVVGQPLYRDYSSNIHSILYAYPFSKRDYLLGKFASGMSVTGLLVLAMGIGLWVGTLWPSNNPAQLLPFDGFSYVQIFVTVVLPNVLLFGAIAFAAVLRTRNIYTAFIAVLLCWLLKEALGRWIGHYGGELALWLDPSGESWVQFVTQFWTLEARNRDSLPLGLLFYVQRLGWVGIAFLIFAFGFRRFSFDQNIGQGLSKHSQKAPEANLHPSNALLRLDLPKPRLDFSKINRLKAVWHIDQTDFRFVTGSGAFVSIWAGGLLMVVALLWQMNPQTDTKLLPFTWSVLGYPILFYGMLVVLLTFLYAGVLLRRAETDHMQALVAATPMPNWVLLLSKWLALVQMQALLLAGFIMAGVLFQAANGFYDFQVEHYLFDLFLVHGVGFAIWALAALAVQVFARNTYSGLFLLVLLYLGLSQLPNFGVTSAVFRFNDAPNADFYLKYSDLSGHAHPMGAFFLYKTYWFLVAIALFALTLPWVQREFTYTWSERWGTAKRRLNATFIGGCLGLLGLGVVVGGWLCRQEQSFENLAPSPNEEKALLDTFQVHYGYLKHRPHPRIVALTAQVEVFPEDAKFILQGGYVLVNKTHLPIDTLWVKGGFDETTRVQMPLGATKAAEDTVFQYVGYRLANPLAPLDTLRLGFRVENRRNTLLVQRSNVLNNGTYLKSEVFPVLGYFADTTPKMPDDSTARQNHYQGIGADLVQLDLTIGAPVGQLGIGPGALVNTWQERDRHYTRYRTDGAVKPVFGIHVGSYEVIGERYRGIDLKIYHHKGHIHNLAGFMQGMKAALDYNILHFGPYQHRQAHIIEFPRSFGNHATTAANCIQISETRFANDPSTGTDLAFYVAAHELSHQWWGNQLLPADALGASMLTESLAEYTTAKIYEQIFGRERAIRFLEIQYTRYRAGHANETQPEPPLYLVAPEQTYLSYGKGALAFYILSEHWGEIPFNHALRQYLDRYRNAGSPYPTALDLLAHLKAVAPDTLRPLLRDLLETNNMDVLTRHFEDISKEYGHR